MEYKILKYFIVSIFVIRCKKKRDDQVVYAVFYEPFGLFTITVFKD